MNRWVLLGLVLLATGCGRSKPSVLLISVESMRADELAAVVNGKPVTPALHDLARESVVFEKAMSVSSWTSPSMMGVMTGLYAPAHGVEEHDRALAAPVSTLAERFSKEGYSTAAILSALTLRPEYGFSKGFQTVDYQPFGHDVITSPILIGKTLHLLDQLKGRPFFLWLHVWDPHYNYIPPAPWNQAFRQGTRPAHEDVQCLKWIENPLQADEALYLRGQYRGELNYTDGYLKQIFDHLRQLGLEENTIVAVVGDHGEAFQEHGWLSHTVRLDQEMIHVPLFLRWKNHLSPARRTGTVSTASLGRTLLRLAGIPEPGTFGSLPGLPLNGESDRPSTAVLSQTVRMGCYTALIGDRYKYTLDHRTCRETFFDISLDPGETRDLSLSNPGEMSRWREELRRQLKAIRDAGIPHASLPPELVEEAEAALRSIGYIAGGESPGQTGEITCSALPDPRTLHRDAFGDVQVFKPCPPDGAINCLNSLGR